MIDWQFLFLAWELKGKYPAILDQPVARELFDDANTLLDEIIADGSFAGARRVRVLAGALRGRRHRAGRSARRRCGSRCCGSRPSSRTAGPTGAWPTTSRRPATTSAGSRSPSTAPTSWPRSTRRSSDDYRAIMVKALADRLAEAFAEYIHLRGAPRLVRAGRRSGDRGPARGAVPGHPARARLPGQPGPQPQAASCSTCSAPSELGMGLTESFAMTPGRRASAGCSSPTRRPGTSPSAGSAGTRSRTTPAAAACPLAEVERWLRPNLAYEPEGDDVMAAGR